MLSVTNKKVGTDSKIDRSTVRVDCGKKGCLLSCIDPTMVFDADSQMWKTKKVVCSKKGFMPRIINAKCVKPAQ